MRAVIQRVSQASVSVNGVVIGSIGQGVLVLLGVERGDHERQATYLAEKTARLRIFSDANDKLNLDLLDVGGSALVVSQFTLCGTVSKGRRPSFVNAAEPAAGRRLYDYFVEQLRRQGLSVATGQFQANMQVALVNDGPVTILLDSLPLKQS